MIDTILYNVYLSRLSRKVIFVNKCIVNVLNYNVFVIKLSVFIIGENKDMVVMLKIIA